MIKTLVSKVEEIGQERCEKCPAFYSHVDYWGEVDEGCTLHRDFLEFCSLSLLPQFVMKPYVKYKERQDERYWEKIYQRERERWDELAGLEKGE